MGYWTYVLADHAKLVLTTSFFIIVAELRRRVPCTRTWSLMFFALAALYYPPTMYLNRVKRQHMPDPPAEEEEEEEEEASDLEKPLLLPAAGVEASDLEKPLILPADKETAAPEEKA
ncbi:hypothetical protein LINGRAHAP2_LOCUS12996 [Linum grandiflorum]